MQDHSRCLGARVRARRRGPAVVAVALTLAAGLLFAGSSPASAQDVGGVVIAASSLQPLAGAQVVVVGTEKGTVTGADGRFLLQGVSGSQVELQVTMLGYRTATRQVAVGTTDLRIALSQSAIALNELVVTGTPRAEQKRSLGNVVSTVDAAAIVAKAPVSNVSEVLNGRVAGVTVLSSTGTVGGATKVRIRGPGTFSLSNTPLLVVDGIRVNNDESSGPDNQAFGSQTISRWNDIDPDDIESIEILKGPAAATLYGTEAAHGVIQIITKKGRQGKMQFNLKVEQGANWFANPEGRLYTNWGMVDTDHDGKGDTLESLSFGQMQDLWKQYGGSNFFNTGHSQRYDLSVSGGSDIIRYFISGGFNQAEGIESSNSVRQGNGRLNLTVTPSEHWSVNGNLGYTQGRTNEACESGCGGVTWSTYYSTPLNIMADSIAPDGTKLHNVIPNPHHGLYSGSPESYHALNKDWQDVGRFIGSVQISNNPAPWFSHRLTFGADQTHEIDNKLNNYDPTYAYWDSFALVGDRYQRDRTINYTTLDYSGTLTAKLGSALESNTSFGAQYYRKHFERAEAYGAGFPVVGLTSVDATTSNRNGTQSFENNTTVGVYGQEQFAWSNRRFFTVGLRADDNSAFGSNFDLVYYPKVSASWVLSDEPFFHLPAIDQLKLRASYGQSGQQPNNFDAIRTFDPATGPNDVATVTPANAGNPDLGPERSSEIELGFDAGLFNDRAGVEFTFYNDHTRDAILLRPIAPSSGFHGSRFINAGEILNRGVEVLLRGTPYTSEKVTWDLAFNVSTNHNEVLSLGTDQSARELAHPVNSWFYPKIVGAQFGANGKIDRASMMCDDGQGGSTPCYEGTRLIAPSVYLGRNSPKVDGGINTTLTLFRRLRLFGQVDFKTGYAKLDGNERVRCLLFSRCRENYVPTDYDPVLIAGYQYGFNGMVVHDASFAKLREVSAAYTLPSRLTQRFGASAATITLAARNLATWTKYTGLEPEATFNGGSRGGDRTIWEQDVTPQLAQFVATINLNF